MKFVSAEPLIEPMDFRPYLAQGFLAWMITGCERTAKGQRQVMNLEWVRDIDGQCREAGVAHFFKPAYVDEKGVPCEEPELDGQVVQEFPSRRVALATV